MAACIRELAEYESGLTSERLQQRGEVEYFYNHEHDLCLYRTNYVNASDERYLFEKHLVDVFSNTMLARYAEEDGQPLTEDVSAFNAEYDRLFQNAPSSGGAGIERAFAGLSSQQPASTHRAEPLVSCDAATKPANTTAGIEAQRSH